MKRAKRLAFSQIVFFCALVFFSTNGFADNLTGRQIIDEIEKRHDMPYEFENQVMVLVGPDRQKEQRQVRRYKRDTEDGARYLLVFHEPAGVRGTSLLTWQFDDKPDDQWLYLPAMGKKLKRIAEGGKRNYFMGTDYTYEDLASEPRDKFSYERQPDQTIDGQDHFIIKAIPVDPKLKQESGYDYQLMYVRKDIFFTTRIDYYNRRGKFIKQQNYQKLYNVKGDTWRANFSIIKNAAENHVTAVQVVGRSFDEAYVPEGVFAHRFITSGRHLR